MKNLLMAIEYDGSGFFGWQRQPGVRTVQGELEAVLSKVCGAPVRIDGTSRTDAGVHAFGQRAGFRGEWGIPTDRIRIAANNLLAGGQNRLGSGGDIRIVDLREVPEGFHARFNARGKTYLYRLRNCREADVFQRNYAYQVDRELDLSAMREAAEAMVGTHDFKCFQASGGKELPSTVRTISRLDIRETLLPAASGCEARRPEGPDAGSSGRLLTVEVTGDGFLYNMVRIIVGTLVDVGVGKLSPTDIPAMIEGRDRQRAGHTAPPQGLYLARVHYDESVEALLAMR